MLIRRQAILVAAFAVMTALAVFAARPAAAEDCAGINLVDCNADESTTAPIILDQSAVLTFSSSVPLFINHNIDAFGVFDNRSGSIQTGGGGNIIYQSADIGVFRPMQDVIINAGDSWFVSAGSIAIHPFYFLQINGGTFGIGPDGGLSFVSADIRGSAGNDTIDFFSGGESIGSTGTLGRAGGTINLGAGDDRFIYYQSAGSSIIAGSITMGPGNNLFGILGSSVTSIFAGDFTGGFNDDTIAFFSGSTATFGSAATDIFLGLGNDVIDFDSGTGVAGGTLIAGTLRMGGDQDTVLLTDNATLEIDVLFNADDGNDIITFTSGGFFDATGATFSMGDGDDIIQFNSVAFTATTGLDVSGGTFTMGAGNDSILFYSKAVGLNAVNTTIGLGDGDDNITFLSSTGLITFVSGSSFLSVDGGAGTDALYLGSAATVAFGSSTGGGNIVNVETVDIGGGMLTYEGLIDANASVINFVSAEFTGATNIAATVLGDAAANTVLFSSGAILSGTINMTSGNDSVSFISSAVLSGTVDMGVDDDLFSAGSGASISGTVTGGGGTDSLAFMSGLTTVTGSIVNFASGDVMANATLHIWGGGSVAVDLSGAGTVRFGSAGAAGTNTLTNAIDGVTLEVAGETFDAGNVTLGGTTPLRGLSVDAGALLITGGNIDLGDGVVDASGTLENDGTIRLRTTARLTADAYDVADPGTFIFEVSRTAAGVTQVGTIMLETAEDIDFFSAGSTFQFVFAGSEGLVTDTVLFISTQPGGLAVAPDNANILGDTILHDFSVTNFNPETLQLQIQQINTIESLADSQNNVTLGNVLLDDLLGSTDQGIIALQDALLFSASPEEFNEVLDGAQPIVHGGESAGVLTMNKQTFGLINQRLAMLRKDAEGNTGISTGNLVRELEAWWQFYGASSEQQTRGQIDGYKASLYGIAGGIDKELIEDGFMGLNFSWGETDVRAKGAGDPASEVDSYMLGLYGDYDFGRAYLNLMVSYGYNDIYTTKTSAAGERTSDYHASHYAARAEIGRTFYQGKMRIIPKLLTHYSYYSPEAYTEEGPAGQQIAGDSLKVFEVGGGFDFQWLMKSGENSYFVPEMRIGYRRDLADEAVAATTRFAAGGSVFEIQGFDPAENIFNFGLGMTYFSKEDWELLFSYGAEYRQDYFSNSGMVRAAYKFY